MAQQSALVLCSAASALFHTSSDGALRLLQRTPALAHSPANCLSTLEENQPLQTAKQSETEPFGKIYTLIEVNEWLLINAFKRTD